jgi:hypothetical protein
MGQGTQRASSRRSPRLRRPLKSNCPPLTSPFPLPRGGCSASCAYRRKLRLEKLDSQFPMRVPLLMDPCMGRGGLNHD